MSTIFVFFLVYIRKEFLMTIYDRIKYLAEQQRLSIRGLEEKLGYGNGTIRRWEKQVPGVDKIQKVADYFNVSVDYLLGRSEEKIDYAALEDAIDNAKSFDGKPMSDNDREVIRGILKGYFTTKK